MIEGQKNADDLAEKEMKMKISEKLRGHGIPDDIINDVIDISLTNPLTDIETNYKQNKHLKENFNLVEPRSVSLGSTITNRRHGAKRRMVMVEDNVYYVPIIDSLEQFLNAPGVFQTCVFDFEKREDFITDFSNGTMFHDHPSFKDSKNSIVLSLYYDDIEICNPLGSKSRNTAVFYYSVLNLPIKYRSKLCNFRLLAVCDKDILNKYGIEAVLHPFITDMQKLHEGYDFRIDGSIYNLKGNLFHVLGDTPASHLIGGFKQGVGFAFSKCRACHCTYEDMQTKFTEDQFKPWTKEEYNRYCADIERADTKYMADYLKMVYGINKRSPLCEIENFDITNHLPMDVMHVMSEGVIQYEIKEVIKYFIANGDFSLKDLNDEIADFPYNYKEVTDMPSLLTHTCINSDDNSLGQSSSQANLLLDILPFVLRLLGISENSEHFAFIVELLSIHKILMAPIISVGTLAVLRGDIAAHLQNFRTLFPHCSIIPKQHYLIHMPSTIKKQGPSKRYSCMRPEGKNKVPKSVIKAKKNFINVPMTISNEMVKVEALETVQGNAMGHVMFKDDLVVGPCKKLKGHDKDAIAEKIFAFSGIRLNTLYKCNHVTLDGIKYIAGKVYLPVGIQVGTILPEFGKLLNIFIGNMNKVFFEFFMHETLYYDENLLAYQVRDYDEAQGTVIATPNELLDNGVLNCIQLDEQMFIYTKFDFIDLISKSSE